MEISTLSSVNRDRKNEWHKGSDNWTGADWSNAMCGESGEAANIVKKLRRHETNIGAGPQAYPGMKDPKTGELYNTPPEIELISSLADELADIILYADLLADHYGIELEPAIRNKFNRVSKAQGFPHRL